MRMYETIYILKPDLEEDLLNSTVEKIQNIIVEQGGVIKDLKRWAKKRLAYKVKKERYGYYVLMHFEGEPELISELERNYRLSEEVIKYLIIKINKGQTLVGMATEEFEEYRAAQDKDNTEQIEEQKEDSAEQVEEQIEDPEEITGDEAEVVSTEEIIAEDIEEKD